MLNKNLPGTVRVYSMGKIKVPKRYLEPFSNDCNYVKLGVDYTKRSELDKLSMCGDIVYYTIMEKVNIPKDFELNIGHITDSIKHLQNIDPDKHETSYLGLSHLYDSIYYGDEWDEDEPGKETIEDLYDMISNDFDAPMAKKLHILMADIVVLFRKLVKNFRWSDIHSGQFGYNTQGELVAFDLDGVKFEGDIRIKTFIKEYNKN